MNRHTVLAVLGILTFTGFILRLYHLTYNSYWLDEAATIWFSTMPSLRDITVATIQGETNPPAFYWLEYFIIKIAGSKELSMRFVPMVAGTLMVPLTYYLGEEVWDDLAGLVAAAFIAFSPWAIFYSQEARAYTLAILLFGIGILYWLRFVRHPGSPEEIKNKYLFPTFMSLAFWFHFYAIFFLAIALIFAYIIRRNKSIVSLVVGGIMALPPVVMLALAMSAHMTPMRAAMFNTIGFNVFTDTANHLFGFNPMVSFILLLLAVVGIFYVYRNDEVTGNAIIALTLVVTAISALLTLLFFERFAVIPRYLGYMIPLLAVCVGVSIEIVPDFFKMVNIRIKNPRIIFAVALIMMMVVINIPSYQLVYGYNKPQWREAADYVKSVANPGDHIAVIPSYTWQPFYHYYPNKTALSEGIFYTSPSHENLQYIASTKTASSKIIFVISPSDYNFRTCFDQMISWMEQNTETKEFYQLNVSIYSGSEIGFDC